MAETKLLLHICCAPCSIACIQSLREEGLSPTGFWYNPNIHPYLEYTARRDALVSYASSIDLPLFLRDEYGLRPFVQAVAADLSGRCSHCYDLRMGLAARHAAENGFDAFTTTLLISPYQNQEQLVRSAQAAADQAGVAFLYRDFRPLFRESQRQARELGLYRQKYCGCVFSEEDRYAHKKPGSTP